MSRTDDTMTSPQWLRTDGDAVLLRTHITPGAARSAVVGEHATRLKIRIAAPPSDGKANRALIRFLAGRIGVSRNRIELVRGASSRQKDLRISFDDVHAVRAALAPETQ